MATLEEYKAVNGGAEPANVEAALAGLGDGGCNVISKDNGGVVGRWSSWEAASVALSELQELGGRYEYRLEEYHEWAVGREQRTTCRICSTIREVPAYAGTTLGIEWP